MKLFYTIIAVSVLLASGCAGSKRTMKFKHLKYPVSISSSLYDGNGKVIGLDSGLKDLGTFKINTTMWSIFWGWIPLGGTQKLDEAINNEVTRKKGEGVVNLSLENDSCRINGIFFFSILPVWPGCFKLKVQGTVVRGI